MIIVGLILAAPLLQNAALCLDDAALHVYRTVALDRALHDGLLYPRWFPDLAYGYGFPFFNYREPFGYYLVELVHLLGASVPLALNLVLAGSLIASGLTMNLWISDVFDRPAGFVAAIVYMAAPYTVLDSLVRANLPEAIALALMPLDSVGFSPVAVAGQPEIFRAGGAVLRGAAADAQHFQFDLCAGAWSCTFLCCVVRSSAKDQPITRYSLLVTLFAFVLALALTAFFWLPALAEGQSAQLYLTHTARGNDYHFNFASAAEVFGPPDPSDPALLNPPLRIALGWAQIVLAVLGVVLIKRLASREQRAHVIIAAIAAAIFIFMALPISQPVWDTLPLIRFVQFPWRFVGRAILPIALLAGAATYAIFHSSLITRHSSRITHYALLVTAALHPPRSALRHAPALSAHLRRRRRADHHRCLRLRARHRQHRRRSAGGVSARDGERTPDRLTAGRAVRRECVHPTARSIHPARRNANRRRALRPQSGRDRDRRAASFSGDLPHVCLSRLDGQDRWSTRPDRSF